MSASEQPPGRPGNLPPEQEEKLREFWGLLLKLCGVSDDDSSAAKIPTTTAQPPQRSDLPANGEKEKVKKRRVGLFSRKDSDSKKCETKPAAVHAVEIADDPDDKYGQTKQFYDTLASMTPEALRETVWSMVKHDHPDALCLRFLRARKWDVEKALIMMVSTMNWRATQMHVDDDIMKRGEAGAIADSASEDPKVKKVAADFMQQLRQGKTFLHGLDKKGSPVCYIRVRLHKIGEQSEESLERYTVYLIETARMMLRPPVDTATMVFDMTGFSMANMDYAPVKFIIKCFEANYPESLSAVIVHKAPWVFQGIWKIIKGWLDPVVANKISFTNNVKEIGEFIPADKVIKELDGQDDWEYAYVEPVLGENDLMKDTATRDRLLASRKLLIQDFENATLAWLKDMPDKNKTEAVKKQRTELATRMRVEYWNLDPYTRARSLYDRIGIITGEQVDFYPAGATTVTDGARVEMTAADLD